RQKVMILAPVVTSKKGNHVAILDKIAKEGFLRARIDGDIIDISQPQELQSDQYHDIEIIIDRIIVKEGIRARLKESVDLALKHGNGTCFVTQQTDRGWSDRFMSVRLACGKCDLSFPDPEPRSFSFNSPSGACTRCQGLGVIDDINNDSPDKHICPECHGARINEFSRSITLNGQSIDQLLNQTSPVVLAWVEELRNTVLTLSTLQDQRVAEQILPALKSRLEYLNEIGLNYIKLSRPAQTLSGGEDQRARLASCLGSGTTGVCYILDEPTAGLHANETEKLLIILRRLKEAGNTVVVVEHDLDMVRASDYILDLGPEAGDQGGEIVASGTYQTVIQNKKSFTSRALNSPFKFNSSNATTSDSAIVLKGAKLHNLQNITFTVPMQKLVCVTGVSGCGKSSLVIETLVPALKAELQGKHEHSLEYDSVEYSKSLQQIRKIDQSPIGRSGRSNPATYCGVWDEIRKLFAKTKLSRLRGYTARRFSFNAKGGRCDCCQGRGYRRVDLQFLPSIYLPCRECKTKRFNRQTLSVKYREKTVSDVLEMPVDEALTFFEQITKIKNRLQLLKELGLGYLILGQPANMLSEGEAQRIKLATELLAGNAGETLFVLDEPTRGLHSADIDRFMGLLRRLIQEGNSVLMIEHHPQAIFTSDWIIDMGPEGGDAGGCIIDSGSPADIAARSVGPTGHMLSDLSTSSNNSQ
ncbi:MAG: ATP-binding cassette domain-containing protein, partial [Gimesia sp.]